MEFTLKYGMCELHGHLLTVTPFHSDGQFHTLVIVSKWDNPILYFKGLQVETTSNPVPEDCFYLSKQCRHR